MAATALIHPEELSGNHSSSFPLSGADTAWTVEGGYADVFAIEDTTGVRHYVMRFEAGEALFGFELVPRTIALHVYPSSDARLVSCRRGTLTAELFDRWVRKFRGFPGISEESSEAVHSAIPAAVEARIAAENERELDRLRRKSGAGAGRVLSALEQLASPLRSDRKAGSGTSGSALVYAFTAVANHFTIPVQVPSELPEAAGPAIQAIAGKSGLRVRMVRLRGAWFRQDGGALVGFRSGRPVGLLPVSSGRYRAVESGADPVVVTRRIAEELDPVAYVLYRPLPVEPLSHFGLAAFCLRGCRMDVLRVGAAGIVTAALGLASPLALAVLLQSVIPSSNRGQLAVLSGMLAIFAVCSALLSVVSNLAMHRIESRAGAALQIALWDRILRLPAQFFRRYNSADLAMRSLGVEQIRQLLAGPAVYSIFTSLLSVLQLPLLYYFGGSMAVPALLFVGAALAMALIAGSLNVRRQRRLTETQTRLSGLILQMAQGIDKLRVAGAESRAFEIWAHGFSGQCTDMQKARRISNTVAVMQACLPSAAAALVVALLPLAQQGEALPNAGNLIAFSICFQQLVAAALLLGGSLIEIAGAVPMVERLQPILREPLERSASAADPGPLSGALEFSNLTFRYSAGGPPVIENLSLRIQPGEFVAFAGASGGGKSTLLRLLLGFEKPESGTVRFDGRDLATLDAGAVRRQIGAVLQDGRILSGDIGANIIGASGHGLDEAWEAARLAAVETDIQAMPMGMHTVLSDSGGTISGGQRQRILIARALIGRPKMIVLDEATSALDNETQAAVSEGIRSLKATRIVIAHRLSTIRDADRIFVLDQGRIVESGSYDDLMNRRGVFHELAKRQLA